MWECECGNFYPDAQETCNCVNSSCLICWKDAGDCRCTSEDFEEHFGQDLVWDALRRAAAAAQAQNPDLTVVFAEVVA